MTLSPWKVDEAPDMQYISSLTEPLSWQCGVNWLLFCQNGWLLKNTAGWLMPACRIETMCRRRIDKNAQIDQFKIGLALQYFFGKDYLI